uniref:Uncharacterized protein n=1 Tax=Glycine max TaxID=3847 RepID=A0A0R0JSL7_SOYBN
MVVTDACKGFLGPDRDCPLSAKAEGSLTARPTRRWKDCRSTDKSYSKDNRLIIPKSSHRWEVCSKGWVVRPLKRYVSWVQNVVRQFGPYPMWALEH